MPCVRQGLHRAARIGCLLAAGMLAAVVATPAAAVPVVFVDALGSCEGNSPCFTTIQAGVNNATAPMDDAAHVRVFPGTYSESVDVSQMGSAVGGGPGELLLINEEYFQILTQPAISATALPAPPAWLPADLIGDFERLRGQYPQAGVPIAGNAAFAVALPPAVLITPPAGPAIHNSVVPHPTAVGILGIDVMAVGDDGVRLSGSGRFGFSLGSASRNLGDGVRLSSSDSVTVSGCVLSENGGAGAYLRSTAAEASVGTCLAERNGSHGFDMGAFGEVIIFRLGISGDPALAGLPTEVVARGNMGSGVVAESQDDNVLLLDFAVFVNLTGPAGIILDDNDENGLLASANGSITAVGVQANGNGASGLDLDAGSELTLYNVTANGNDSDGIQGVGETAFGFAITANDNVNGINLTTSGIREWGQPLFPDLATLLLATTTNDNMLMGLFLTATGGPIGAYAPVSVGNDVSGVRLVPPFGTQNVVNGGIFCSSAFGLTLASNAQVNAQGNWWGSASGPFHATKNPGGMGVAVADGSSGGGAGDANFAPWIDTVTASAPYGAVLAAETPIRFQFSGGGGTVFLGLPQGFFLPVIGPGAQPPFTVETNNGLVMTVTGKGPTATTFLTDPNGIAEVALIPSQVGEATVTLSGPCGLGASLSIEVRALQIAPALSQTALLLTVVILVAVAALAMRRRRNTYAREVPYSPRQ